MFQKRQREVRVLLVFFGAVDLRHLFTALQQLSPPSALSQAAGLVVSASDDKTLCVWRLAGGACLRTLTGHTGGVHAVVDVGGGRVASGGWDGVLRVWDVLSGKQLQQTLTEEGCICCADALWGNLVSRALRLGTTRARSGCGA